jgi:hypothetical protein
MSKNPVLYKSLVVGVIVLFIGVGVQPAFADVSFKNIGSAGFIQSLINNASNGDTIYIPSGTYYEHIQRLLMVMVMVILFKFLLIL